MQTPQPDETHEQNSTTPCPACGADGVREEFSGSALFGLIFLAPLVPTRRLYSCQSCGHAWKRYRW